MFGKKEDNFGINYNLVQILKKQHEILRVLESIDNNIIKYFGEEHDLEERELNKEIMDAHFNDKQIKVLKKYIEYTKKKYKENS